MNRSQNVYGKDNPHALRDRLIGTLFLNLILASSFLGANAIVHHHVAQRPQIVQWK